MDFLIIREPENIRAVYKQLLQGNLTGDKMVALGLLENSLRGVVFPEVIIDKWPDFTTLIVKHKPLGTEYYIAIYSTDTVVLEKLLSSSGIMPWREKMTFRGVHEDCLPSILKVVKSTSKDGKIDPNSMVKLKVSIVPETIDPSRIPKLPPGYTMRLLVPSDAEFVDSVWPYGGTKDTVKCIAYAIANKEGLCVTGPEGNIVGINMVNWDESYGKGWVHPNHRGAGLAKISFDWHTNLAKKSKRVITFSLFEVNNRVSRGISMLLNAKILDETVCRFKYVPPGQVKASKL